MFHVDWLLPWDDAVHRIVPKTAGIERIAGGFGFTEGPLWTRQGDLLFSDIPNNTIFRWRPDATTGIFRHPSGYDGPPVAAGALVGSNGLTLDRVGRVCVCEHGNRRVTRLEDGGGVTVLADRFEGRRLNAPNDLVFHSNGALYFTDPPYGLPGLDRDPAKELDFNGVFRLDNGALSLLFRDLSRPNGLALSPDESVLYVANSDRARMIWLRFSIADDGSLSTPDLFADVTRETGAGVPDGMKVDVEGNLYCTGPGGIRIFEPGGKPLGLMAFPEVPANLHWGGADACTLYVTARTSVYRVTLSIPGVRP